MHIISLAAYNPLAFAYWGVKTHLKLDCCPLGTTSLGSEVTEIDLDDNTAFNLSSNPDKNGRIRERSSYGNDPFPPKG